MQLGVAETDILIINSQEDKKVREIFFENIEEESKKYKVLLTTACLTIGVDINTSHFKSAIGVFSHDSASA